MRGWSACCRRRWLESVLFAAALDEYGPDETFFGLLRTFRKYPDCLNGCLGGVFIDGAGELYTKQAARELVLAANLAGCAFPGKPLVEGTGSLYNQHIQAGLLHLSWEQTYAHQLAQLAQRLLQFELPSFDRPKLLMLHASDNMRSNTVWLGKQVLAHLPATFETKTISLQNGSIHDCRGCSYEACLHFAAQSRCFYGGSISDEVLPAISACDAMLFLCPNYNDAVSANIMALFNRLTNLLVKQDLYQKYLYGIVVSGYSGSDIVARQLLGAMCLNKTAILPPKFCLMQTAHDPGSVRTVAGIDARITEFVKPARLTKQAAGCKIALSFKASLNKRISPNAMRKKSNAGHGHREPGMLGSRRQRLRERTLLSSNLNRKRPQ